MRCRLGTRLGLVVSVGAITGVAWGLFVVPDMEGVPFERLLANAQQRVREKASLHRLHDLARLHGMGFARNLEATSEVAVHQSDGQPYFGYPSEVPWVPFAKDLKEWRAEGLNLVPTATALEHLDRAIELYGDVGSALWEEPRHPRRSGGRAAFAEVSDLGLAWCLRQRALARPGRRTRDSAHAASILRGLVWNEKSRSPYPAPYRQVLASEAATYFLEILESGDAPRLDREEIGRIKAHREELLSVPRAITPLAIDLTGQGAPGDLVDRGADVAFDLDGSDLRQRWTWITPRAAWLVWDPRGTGEVRGALQLFGNRTFNLFHTDGFAALALLDDDGDGVLRGEELEGLAAWRDVDADGVSTVLEVTPLSELGVVELETRPGVGENGWLVARGGARKADGPSYDVWDLVLETAPEETTSVASDWMKVKYRP